MLDFFEPEQQWQINIDSRYEVAILWVDQTVHDEDEFDLDPDCWSRTWDSAYNKVKANFDCYGTKIKAIRIFDRMARRGQLELWTFYPDRNGNFDRHNVVGEHKD